MSTARAKAAIRASLETSKRWFVSLNPDDPIWVPSVFSKNRGRLIEGHIAEAFLQELLRVAESHELLSHEHFTVDGTLLDASASQKCGEVTTARDALVEVLQLVDDEELARGVRRRMAAVLF